MSYRGYGRKNRGKNRQSPYSQKDTSWMVDRGDSRREREGLLPGPPREEFPPPALMEIKEELRLPVETENNDPAPPAPVVPKKFTNKARLFFGNLPRDFTESELKNILTTYGEVQEIYHNKEKNFAFARMAYRSEAEKVIVNHNGQTIRGRDIKVRFAASSCSVKIANLNPTVSNELLAEAFSYFGDVEEAIVATDDRGKPLGYGVVDFARKGQAVSAIQQCRNGPFLLTKTPVPVIVTEMVRDNEDGLPEKQLPKNNAYHFEREAPPRFPQPGSLEYDVAMRWKAFFDQEKTERNEMEERVKTMKAAIQKDMDTIKEQHQTIMLRQEIARHQMEQQRLAERLREQEERLKGLQGGGSGLLPMFGQVPQPLFPPPPGTLPDGSATEVPTSQPVEVMMPQVTGQEYAAIMPPPMPPSSLTPYAAIPPPLMGQQPR